MSVTTTQEAPKKAAAASNAIKFLFGGLSGMGATMVVQPLDLVRLPRKPPKNQLPYPQISPSSGENPHANLRGWQRQEGVP